ncbi:uncharacterized protein LOC110819823 [Carica papaya]|uniref:uncharacterized protein LOC110819823 n=1 Tax=Carica papaya TaxID=3649 RepID=UPI000B8CF30B|nr:uncharacterized protein LOC110819823 [Carica papaya]
MHGNPLLYSSNPISQCPLSLFIRHRLISPFRWEVSGLASVSSSSRVQWPLNFPQTYRNALCHLHSTASQEIVETSNSGSGYVEIGFLSSVHGLQGDVCVKPSTDFPELRFSTPGRRWLRQQVSGRETIQEVELGEGREHPGKKSWILKIKGIDTVEQAKQLVGSTLLATEEDRPELEEGEFYTRDLIGMRVILKETGELVGTVVNVFNSGASDLLQVMLVSFIDMPNGSAKPEVASNGQSGSLVWVPFVEAIVPDVDLRRRELKITPPKGLLELNLRCDERSKKERRQLAWKERKKLQKRLVAAKRKLYELGQQHVFHGFASGEKSQRSSLTEQIIVINTKLFQQALQNIEIFSRRWNVTEQMNEARAKLLHTLKISEDCFIHSANECMLQENCILQQRGLFFLSKGKLAFCLVINDIQKSTENSSLPLLQKLLCDDHRFGKKEDRHSVPLVLVCPTHAIEPLQKLFLDHDHFAFNSQKVWFLEEEKLPIVSNSLEEQKKHKILLESRWQILQSPVGSGGVISSLSSQGILEDLAVMGVEYIQIFNANTRYVGNNSVLLGFVDSQEVEIGIQIYKDAEDMEESYNMIFHMNTLKKLTKQLDKLRFYPVPKLNSYVEKAGKDWISVVPSFPNSYELRSSIYSCLNSWPSDKICLMEITQ